MTTPRLDVNTRQTSLVLSQINLVPFLPRASRSRLGCRDFTQESRDVQKNLSSFIEVLAYYNSHYIFLAYPVANRATGYLTFNLP